MNDFLPSTPQQRDFNNPLLELRERKVRTWIGELPLHEPIEAIPLLLEVLSSLNLDPLADKERMRLLELYRAPVMTLNQSWDHLKRQLGELPPDRQQTVMEQFAELLWQLAAGYKIVVRNGHDAARSPQRDKLLLLATYRVMEQLSITLLDAYRRYAAVPPQAFREFNQCYHFAESHGVQDRPAPIDRKTTTPHTPAVLFKRAALLAAADPFRLPAGHAVRLHQLLTHYAHHCRLARPPWTEAIGRFVIDVRDDRPPLPCSKANTDNLSPGAWVLDISPLRAAVQQRINEAHDPDRTLQELDVLRRLLPNLSTPPKRRAPRQKSDKELRVATGLDAAHHFLTSAGEEQIRRSVEGTAYGIEVFDAESESQTEFMLEPWKVVNESPKGYLLTRRHALDERLRVGEALGLFPRRAGDKQPPEIGIVRWIRRGEEGWVQIGVEVIPGCPAAVHCAPLDPYADPFDEPLAIYLRKVPTLPIPPTLLARRSLYRKDSAITLTIERQRGKAAIGSLVLETDCLVRLTLKPFKPDGADGA